jgi:hypothetical protein
LPSSSKPGRRLDDGRGILRGATSAVARDFLDRRGLDLRQRERYAENGHAEDTLGFDAFVGIAGDEDERLARIICGFCCSSTAQCAERNDWTTRTPGLQVLPGVVAIEGSSAAAMDNDARFAVRPRAGEPRRSVVSDRRGTIEKK